MEPSVHQTIFVQQSGSAIVAIEYYFDDGTTTTPVRTYSNFTPGKDITLDFAAVLDGLLPSTTYTIHLSAINADNQRSTEVIHVLPHRQFSATHLHLL